MSFRTGISRAALKRAGVEVRPGDLGSDLEGRLVSAVHLARLPPPEREVRLVEGRLWASDFVWRPQRVVVEVEGGTHSGGRHTRGKGFAEDCRKYNELAILGWTLIRVTGEHIASGEAVAWIERALSTATPSHLPALLARHRRFRAARGCSAEELSLLDALAAEIGGHA